jgi:Uma2 family endonuclease
MTTSPQIPLLRAGDRLTRAEFERRYAAMPNVKKAELLEGVVHMPSPVRHTHHGLLHGLLAGWLLDYVRASPGTQLSIGATLRLADENEEPQPDLVLFVLPPKGTARIDAEGYLVGPPELVVEVAASSAARDLDQKLQIFRRAGVSEYLVVRVGAAAVDWFVLRNGSYERLAADPQDTLRSEVFPGLWLDAPALLRADDSGVHSAVQAGVRTAEHGAFLERLARLPSAGA